MPKTSYNSIFKSSAIVGGARVITLLIGLIRTKVVAVLLGTAGMGLIGTLLSIQQFALVFAGLGINQSGVRDIAEARESGDDRKISEIVTVLRRLSLLLGLVGTVTMIGLSVPLSRLTFGDASYAFSLCALGISVMLGLICAAQMALLQAFRRIKHMALASIMSALFGTAASILWYFWIGIDGVVPSILTLSVIALFFTWIYARRIEVEPSQFNRQRFYERARGLLGLGFAFMWNGLAMAVVAYGIRYLIINEYDLSGVGIYAAAFSVSGMVVNFVISAMSADFVPRLSEASKDHERMIQIVNEQVEIGVLMALPGVAAVIVFADVIVRILYTKEFSGSAILMQWFALGCFARVFQWPIGYIALALKKGRLFMAMQTCFAFMHLSLVAIGIKMFDLEGVSIAFVLYNILTYLCLFCIVKRLVNFSWREGACSLLVSSVSLLVLVFLFTYFCNSVWLMLVPLILLVFICLFCLRGLYLRLDGNRRLDVIIRYCPFLLRRYLFPERI